MAPFFRAAIAFYPGCSVSLRDARWKPAAPLAILIGATSDQRRAALPAWLRFGNEERPHASLQKRPPLSKLVQLAEQRS